MRPWRATRRSLLRTQRSLASGSLLENNADRSYPVGSALGGHRVNELFAEMCRCLTVLDRQAKIALKASSEDQLLELEAVAKSINLCARSIHDAGRTQVAAGSRTVLGIGPGLHVSSLHLSAVTNLYWRSGRAH